RYHTTPAAIAQVNSIDADVELQSDAKLIIPVTPGREVDRLTFSNHATRYKVRKGDTVLSIADDFGVPAERLRKWNHIRGNYIRSGRVIRIYRPTGVVEEASSRSNSRGRGKNATVAKSNKGPVLDREGAPEITDKPKGTSSLEAASAKTVRHKVKRGETLTSIANSYNTSIAQLKRDNKLESNELKAGQVLLIK
ncbi:MAG TPA: LysM peptidoglycan-binding domain-containing protein, partial [Terriglobales bacterium]|nr:LysM peptidoglycan-binding domain-containing protein [Terriglobales bacterium]